MKIILLMILVISFLFGVDKNQNRHNSSEAFIQLNIKKVETFDFIDFEREYSLELQYCVGTSICFFKPSKEIDIKNTVDKISIYGKANIYKPYRLKIY